MREDTIGRPMDILLVEDSLASARLTIGALRKSPVAHRLTWLTDGDEALEFLMRREKYAQAPQPDLVLLDLGLPGRDGCEVLAEIRADDRLRQTAVVILTASTAARDIEQVEQLTVQSYMTKPVDLEEFLRVVQEVKAYWHKYRIGPGSADKHGLTDEPAESDEPGTDEPGTDEPGPADSEPGQQPE